MGVEFLFLFSPNNSGTTVIGQYLETQTHGYLPPFGYFEGQMAPSVKEIMRADPWNPEQVHDWSFIRREWATLADEAGKSLFIECSPPNIMRTEQIRSAFTDAAHFLVSTSSPYSFVASNIYNYVRPPLGPTTLKTAAEAWAMRAARLMADCMAHPDTPRITYEAFCKDCTTVNRALGIGVQPFGKLKGKANNPVSRIVDMSNRNLAFLTFDEWDQVNEVLEEHRPLVDFFGYEIRPGEELIVEATATPALFHAGILRRLSWDTPSHEK